MTPAFTPFVIPLALVILVGLFMLQARGTADVGRLFGPVMFVWFLVLGVLGAWQIAKNPVGPGSDQPDPRLLPGHGPGIRHLLGFRFDRAGRYGRGGPLCRHGPFRPPADPDRLVRHRHAGSPAQLLRPGGAHHRESGRDPSGLLRAGAGRLHHLPGDPLHAGDRDCLAGGDHRRVLADPAGNPARLPAAHGDPPHVRDGDRPDLHPEGQLAPDVLHHRSRGRLRIVRRTGRRLWPGRHGRHAGRCGARHGGRDPGLALVVATGGGGVRLPRHPGSRLLHRQCAQDSRRRLAAADRGLPDLFHDHDLETRPPDRRRRN